MLLGRPLAHRTVARCAGATGVLAVVIAALRVGARGDVRAAVCAVPFAILVVALRAGILRPLRT